MLEYVGKNKNKHIKRGNKNLDFGNNDSETCHALRTFPLRRSSDILVRKNKSSGWGFKRDSLLHIVMSLSCHALYGFVQYCHVAVTIYMACHVACCHIMPHCMSCGLAPCFQVIGGIVWCEAMWSAGAAGNARVAEGDFNLSAYLPAGALSRAKSSPHLHIAEPKAKPETKPCALFQTFCFVKFKLYGMLFNCMSCQLSCCICCVVRYVMFSSCSAFCVLGTTGSASSALQRCDMEASSSETKEKEDEKKSKKEEKAKTNKKKNFDDDEVNPLGKGKGSDDDEQDEEDEDAEPTKKRKPPKKKSSKPVKKKSSKKDSKSKKSKTKHTKKQEFAPPEGVSDELAAAMRDALKAEDTARDAMEVSLLSDEEMMEVPYQMPCLVKCHLICYLPGVRWIYK